MMKSSKKSITEMYVIMQCVRYHQSVYFTHSETRHIENNFASCFLVA